jgi:bifunctional non-homologous end joining protein LigD
VFDILELRGRDVRNMALLDRKQTLGDAIGTGPLIRPVGYVPSMGIELFNAANEAGLEGIVAKREDSPYRRGRSRDWIKIKTAHGRAIDDERANWNER